MLLKRILVAAATLGVIAVAAVLYTAHPVWSSDHQDTYNLATSVGHNTSADITDVYVYPAPDNANNVVFAMNVSPLITPLAKGGTPPNFDPTLLWQFKISHQTSGVEDEVIQMVANSTTGSAQTMTLYGPAKPNEVGTVNTLLNTQATGSTTFNNSAQLQNNTVQFFAGERTDTFVFDLFAFFQFAGDRNYGTHSSQSDPGSAPGSPNAPALGTNGDSASNIASLTTAGQKAANPAAPSFNGFASGTMSGTGSTAYACSTVPAFDTLDYGKFDVLTYVVEVPKTLLTTGYSGSTIHVWATVSSSKTTS